MNLDTSHHAFLLEAVSIAESGLPEDFLLTTVDTEHLVLATFGIDDARALTMKASHKTLNDEWHTFVIFADTVTVQAQNALLKLFEEPPAKTRFVLVMSDISPIIDTLRSRCILLDKTEESKAAEVGGAVRDFLDMSIADQLSLVADKTKAKDNAWINKVVSAISAQADQTKDITLMQAAIFTSSRINGPGASKKMLLEDLVLSLHRN